MHRIYPVLELVRNVSYLVVHVVAITHVVTGAGTGLYVVAQVKVEVPLRTVAGGRTRRLGGEHVALHCPPFVFANIACNHVIIAVPQ